VVERARARGGVRIEQAALEAGGVSEADCGRDALAERAGGDLDPVGVAVLGVARRLGAPRAQRLEVIELKAVAAEVELDILGERAVPSREDEPVPTQPLVVAGVAAHDLLEEQVRGGSEAHRRAGMTVAHLLHGVSRQDPCGVNRGVVDGIPLQSCHVDMTFRDRRPLVVIGCVL
jgi:hypothetical protein